MELICYFENGIQFDEIDSLCSEFQLMGDQKYKVVIENLQIKNKRAYIGFINTTGDKIEAELIYPVVKKSNFQKLSEFLQQKEVLLLNQDKKDEKILIQLEVVVKKQKQQ